MKYIVYDTLEKCQKGESLNSMSAAARKADRLNFAWGCVRYVARGEE